MSRPLPTVRITHPELPGGIVINESEFNPDEHELFDQPAPNTEDPSRRSAQLDALPLALIRKLAAEREVEFTDRNAAIAAIVASEFAGGAKMPPAVKSPKVTGGKSKGKKDAE